MRVLTLATVPHHFYGVLINPIRQGKETDTDIGENTYQPRKFKRIKQKSIIAKKV